MSFELQLQNRSGSSACAAALDRLNWCAALSMVAFDVRLGVRSDDAGWLARLCERLPPGWRTSGSAVVDHLYSFRRGGIVPGTQIHRFFVGYNAESEVVRTLDECAALDAFESAVEFDVAVSATQWTFVHAGAVGWNGRAIVIPAPSMHGKSRLVEALVRAGASYYSDEFAVIDAFGRVHPFPTPLKLRDESGASHRQTPEQIGATVGRDPLAIGLIVSTTFDPAARWQPRKATAAEAILALLGNTVRARLDPSQTLRTLARAVGDAEMLIGPRGAADRVADELLSRLDSEAHRPPDLARMELTGALVGDERTTS